MDLSQLLQCSYSADQNTRVQATQHLEQAACDNLPLYLSGLTQILADESAEVTVRVAAGLAAKNCLVARDAYRRATLINAFSAIDPQTKDKIKKLSLEGIKATESKAASAAAQLVAALAYVELPLNEWPDLIRTLHFNIVSETGTANVRKASLETIGFICEEANSSVLAGSSDLILSAVVHGLGANESVPAVRQAAATALLNSLEFIRGTFEAKESDRDRVMRAVFEAITCQDESVCVPAFECLVKMANIYYVYMKPYMMQGLGELTINAISSSIDNIALQGIEFWSTICETEIEIKEDLEHYRTNGSYKTDLPICHDFAEASVATVLPILLNRMASQSHDDEDDSVLDDWVPSMAAATCLSLYANCIRDAILTDASLRKFIHENLSSTDWHFREAAVLAFGSVLDGPSAEAVEPLALQTFPALFRLFNDPSVSVRDTNYWALGKVCEIFPQFIPIDHSEQLAVNFVAGLRQQPRVATNAAWAVMHLMRRLACPEGEDLAGRIFPEIAKLLIEASNRPDADEAQLRTSTYQALCTIITDASVDSNAPVLVQIMEFAAVELEKSVKIAVEALSVEDHLKASELQSNCCALVLSCIRRLGGEEVVKTGTETGPVIQRVVAAFVAICQAGVAGKTSLTSLEDMFLALDGMVNELESHAAWIIEPFFPYMLGVLSRPEETQLCKVVIGLVSDVNRCVKGEAVSAQADRFYSALLLVLQSPTASRSLKPLAITALGDLCSAIGGPTFVTNYLNASMNIFAAASKIGIVDENDLDEVDFVCALRQSLIDALTWIVQGAKDENNRVIPAVSQALLPHVLQTVLPFLRDLAQFCLTELGEGSNTDPVLLDGLIRSGSGLIGDMADVYAADPSAEALRANLKPFAVEFLQIASDKIGDSTVATQKWARTQVQSLP